MEGRSVGGGGWWVRLKGVGGSDGSAARLGKGYLIPLVPWIAQLTGTDRKRERVNTVGRIAKSGEGRDGHVVKSEE